MRKFRPYSKLDQSGKKKKKQSTPGKPKKNKFGNVRTLYKGIHFRSKLEARYAEYLDLLVMIGEVEQWEYESKRCRFTLRLEGYTYGTYTIDFWIKYKDGREEFIEVKGAETREWKKKYHMFKYLYPELSSRVVKTVPRTTFKKR